MALNTNQRTDTITPSTGTMNVAGTLQSNGVNVLTASAVGALQFVSPSTDQSTTSDEFASTGVSFSAGANAKYIVELVGVINVTNANAAPIFVLDVPGAAAVVGGQWGGEGGGSVEPYFAEQNADNESRDVNVVSIRTTSVDLPVLARWVVITGATPGAVTLNYRVKSTSGGGTATLKTASVLSYTQVS